MAATTGRSARCTLRLNARVEVRRDQHSRGLSWNAILDSVTSLPAAPVHRDIPPTTLLVEWLANSVNRLSNNLPRRGGLDDGAVQWHIVRSNRHGNGRWPDRLRWPVDRQNRERLVRYRHRIGAGRHSQRVPSQAHPQHRNVLMSVCSYQSWYTRASAQIPTLQRNLPLALTRD